MTKRLTFSILLVILSVISSFAQSVTLVKDILPGNSPSSLSHFTKAFGMLFFADTGLHLWASDGTALGTVLVDPNVVVDKLFFENGELYISGYDAPFLGIELYKYDPAFGTIDLVKDINLAGTVSSYPSNFIHLGTTLYFEANDGVHGRELWKSDGTDGGTVMVKDISLCSTAGGFSNPILLNNMIYFSAFDPTNGYALWKTDGTTVGTVMVKDCNLLSASIATGIPKNLTVINSNLYFSLDDGVHGEELWKSDGTAEGTQLVKDLRPGPEGIALSGFTEKNASIFFKASDFIHSELWVTDGTAEGTTFLRSFEEIQELNVYNGQFFLNNRAAVNPTQYELWTSDGTVAGTTLVSEKAFTSGQLISGHFYKVVNKENPLSSGIEIIKSEGTECRTKTVNSTGTPVYYVNYLAVGAKIFMSAFNSANGLELYVYDTSSDPGFACQSQSITFPAIADQTYGIPYDLIGSASSGLPVSYSLSATNIVALESNVLSFTGIGTFSVTATQNGNASFDPAPSVTRLVTIKKRDQSIDFPPLSPRLVGSELQLSAIATSDLTVNFAVSPTDKTTLSGSLMSFAQPGVITITASQPGNTFYNAAPDQAQTICINPPLPLITSDGKLDGATLFSSSTSGNQWYKDGTAIADATLNSYTAAETGGYSVEATTEGCASGKSALFPLIVTGIDGEHSLFLVYPNPVGNELHLAGLVAPSDIHILDLCGRTFITHKVSDQTKTILNVSDLQSGIYLIEVIASKDRFVGKFVKK